MYYKISIKLTAQSEARTYETVTSLDLNLCRGVILLNESLLFLICRFKKALMPISSFIQHFSFLFIITYYTKYIALTYIYTKLTDSAFWYFLYVFVPIYFMHFLQLLCPGYLVPASA